MTFKMVGNNDDKFYMIPKNIIQTYKTFESIPIECKNNIKKIKELHPDYNYMFYDDNDVQKFMETEFKNLLSFYYSLPYNIQRFDLFRILVVYRYGGFYFDIDVNLTKRIDDKLLDSNIVFPVEFTKDYMEWFFRNQKKPDYFYLEEQLGQYAFASQPKHTFLKEYLINILRKKISCVSINDKKEYVCCTTGPRILTLTYYQSKLKNHITLLHNSQNMNMTFGDYGRHTCLGSWL